MIRIEGLTITFDRPILENISFQAIPATKVSIDGKSGSGKTTILKFIMGELIPQSGKLYFNNEEITAKNREEFLFNNVSYVDQMGSYFTNMTIHQHFMFYSQLHHLEVTKEQEIEYLKMVALEDIELSKSPSYLSTGQRKRFLMALALMMKKQIILLDEPTASLDNRSKEKLIEVLTSLTKEGVTIIMATHDDMILDNSDYIYTIKEYKLICNREISSNTSMIKENNKPNKVRYTRYKNIKLKILFIIFLCLGCVCTSLISQTISTSVTLNLLNNQKIDADENVALFFSKQLDVRHIRDWSMTLLPNGYTNDMITNEDIEKVKGIDGVLEMEPYYVTVGQSSDNDTFSIYKDEQLISKKSFNYTFDNGLTGPMTPYISSYYPFQNIKYNGKKATGVYINQRFAELVQMEDVSGLTLEFDVYVPEKVTKNFNGVTSEGIAGVPEIHTLTKRKTVKIKVDGVLPNLNYDISGYSDYEARIYMPAIQLKTLIDSYPINYEGFDVPYTEYQSTQYMVYCDGNKVEEIKLAIEEIDDRYVVTSQKIGDVMVKLFTNYQNQSSTTMTILMTSVLLIGTILLAIYIIYQRKCEVKLLKNEGLKKYITNYYLKDYYVMAIIWCVISIGYSMIYPKLHLFIILESLPICTFLVIWAVSTLVVVIIIIMIVSMTIKKIYIGSDRK